MQTIELKTSIFPTEQEGDLDTCNGQPGSAFANWLKEELTKTGIDCDNLIQEDYGWGFWVNSNNEPIWVCVSYGGGDTNEGDNLEPVCDGSWFVSANHEIPFLFLKPWQWNRKETGKKEEAKIFALLKDSITQNNQMEILSES